MREFTCHGPDDICLGQHICMPQDLGKVRHCAGLPPIEFENGEKPCPFAWKARYTGNQCDYRLVNALTQYRVQVQAVSQCENSVSQVGFDMSYAGRMGMFHSTYSQAEDDFSFLALVLASGLIDPTALTVLRLPFCSIHVGSVLSRISIWLRTTSTLTLLE